MPVLGTVFQAFLETVLEAFLLTVLQTVLKTFLPVFLLAVFETVLQAMLETLRSAILGRRIREGGVEGTVADGKRRRDNEFDDELVHGFVLSVPVGVIAAHFQERSRNAKSTCPRQNNTIKDSVEKGTFVRS